MIDSAGLYYTSFVKEKEVKMKKKKFVGIMALFSLVFLNLTSLSAYAKVTDYQMADTGVEETSAECQVIYKSTYDFSEEIPKYPEVEVSAYGYEGVYDGEYHGISVDCRTDGCQILYSEDGVNFTTMKPEYKEPGTYVVYYRIVKDNYATVIGSRTIIIKEKDNGIKLSDTDGTVKVSDSITFSVDTNGEPFDITISDPSIASWSVDKGVVSVTGLKVGKAVITITSNGNSAAYILTVTNLQNNQENNDTSQVQTGDLSDVECYIIMLGISTVGLAVFARRKMKGDRRLYK